MARQRVALIVSLFLAVLLVRGDPVLISASPAPREPAIDSVEPAVLREWGNFVVRGRGLKGTDGSCPLSVSGRPAYVFSCTDTEVRAVTPWISGQTTLTPGRAGGETAARSVSLAPLSEGGGVGGLTRG